MPVPTTDAAWWGSSLWLVGVATAAFLIAWLSGTRLHIRKGPYIPALLAVTAGLSIGYMEWVGVSLDAVVTNNWGWGIGAGLLIGAVLSVPARRQPIDRPIKGSERRIAFGWEGVVYGIGEGVLLSARPPFIAWQMVHALGWAGTAGGIARWILPLLAATAVVVIHHLGYWNYRNRILIPVGLALTVLAAGFLVTASWLTPAVAHIVLHVTLIVHGSEMPPCDRPVGVASIAPSQLSSAA